MRLVDSRSGGDGRLPRGNARAAAKAARKVSRAAVLDAAARVATATTRDATNVPVRMSFTIMASAYRSRKMTAYWHALLEVE